MQVADSLIVTVVRPAPVVKVITLTDTLVLSASDYCTRQINVVLTEDK